MITFEKKPTKPKFPNNSGFATDVEKEFTDDPEALQYFWRGYEDGVRNTWARLLKKRKEHYPISIPQKCYEAYCKGFNCGVGVVII